MPWATPRAVAITLEQLRACADCGARLKAAIALTVTAANKNLFIALSSLDGWCVASSEGFGKFRGRHPQPADLRSIGMSSVLESTSPGLYTRLNMIAAARSHLARSSRDQTLLVFGSFFTS